MLATSVQLVPSQVSVLFVTEGVSPPPSIADVCDPAPPTKYLVVFALLTSVHADPFQDSVLLTIPVE